MSLLHIFDVSAYQSGTVPACDAVFVKATEGKSYTSSQFATQWVSAKTRAKARGAYHFARPEQSSALVQADRLIETAKPQPGDMLCLDLEESGLSQAATNAWAKAFGQRLRDRAPGTKTVLYMGSGYASTGTGRGLAAYFDLWWYPQYPSTARTSTWPSVFSPWLPSGIAATGWSKPHIWQFTDNFGGLDASVTALTLDQLAGTGGQQPEDDMAYAQVGVPPLKVGERFSFPCPKGAVNIWGIWFDSPHKLHYRIAAHSQGGHGDIQQDLVVGGPASASDSWPRKATWLTPKTDVDSFSIELVKAEGPSADWDPTMPGADGKVVRPGWDASHTA